MEKLQEIPIQEKESNEISMLNLKASLRTPWHEHLSSKSKICALILTQEAIILV